MSLIEIAEYSFSRINETNAFWELKLADSPENASRYAGMKAKEYLKKTEELLAEGNRITNPRTQEYQKKLMEEAKASHPQATSVISIERRYHA